MSVTAIYELPVPIWISKQLLGERIGSGIGRIKFDVLMPTGGGPGGGPPDVQGLELPPAPKQHTTPDQSWTHRFAAFPSDPDSTALCRVVVQTTGPEAPNEAYDLARVIDLWFDAVRTWAEAMTGQDLDPHHQVYSATSHGARLIFLDPAPTSDGPIALSLTTPRVMPVGAKEWRFLLAQVAAGNEPPLEEQLSRDSRATFARDQYRRSVIDAASVAEIVLHRLISATLTEANLPNGEYRRKLVRLDKQPLGELVDIVVKADVDLDVDTDALANLVEIRNNAIHRGIEPNSTAAFPPVQSVMELLGRHGQWKRSAKAPIYGDEWEVVEPTESA